MSQFGAKRFELLSVRLPGSGMHESVLGMATFGYYPAEFDEPLKVTRYVAPPENAPAGAKGVNFDVATVTGARAVKIHDAIVANGRNGPWLQLNGVQIPRDVADRVALEAAGKLHAMGEAAARAKPLGYTGDGADEDPFASAPVTPSRKYRPVESNPVAAATPDGVPV